MRRRDGMRILVDSVYQYNRRRCNCDNVTSKGRDATYRALPKGHSEHTECKRVRT